MTKVIGLRSQYSGKVIKCQDHASLARHLLKTHGLETALKICQSHHWYGVIKILESSVFNSDKTVIH